MEWLRAHPYASAIGGAFVLLVVGIFIVERRATTPQQSQGAAWVGGDISYLNPQSYAPSGTNASEATILEEVKSGPPYTYIPPKVATTSAQAGAQDSFDFDSFAAMLLQGSASVSTAQGTGAPTLDPYAFIPQGFVSTTSVSIRSGQEQALYDYGNEIGSYIQSFEEQHQNMVQVLKNQIEDRTSSEKAAPVLQLASALRGVGESLQNMDTVPTGMRGAHSALAESYIEIGTKLALVPKAERDADLIEAIQTYNAAADVFTKNYVALATLFGAYGVTFSPSDAGSVFMFSAVGL